MPRAKRGFKARRRRKKVLTAARGTYGARSRLFRTAVEQLHNSVEDAYRHRKTRKREYRRLWIARINAAARIHGMSYSRFMSALKKADINLNRKVLADIAMHDADGFKVIVDHVAA